MTDIEFTLVERLKLTDQFQPNADVTTDEVVSAIEAMQSKLGDAIQSSAHWKHQFTEAQAENERLKSEREALRDSAKEVTRLRDQLQSKLDAMGTGEPVAIRYKLQGDINWQYTENRDQPTPPCVIQELFAAPKALAPEQVEAAWRAGWAACRDAEFVGQEAEDEAWGMSDTCANADWESAAPKALAPLGRDTVKAVMSEAGYIHVSAQSKADFINGIRHGEKAHGIGGTP